MESRGCGRGRYTETTASRQLLLRTALVSKLLSLSSPLFKSSRWVAGWPQRVFLFGRSCDVRQSNRGWSRQKQAEGLLYNRCTIGGGAKVSGIGNLRTKVTSTKRAANTVLTVYTEFIRAAVGKEPD